jgi:hypothetical protein
MDGDAIIEFALNMSSYVLWSSISYHRVMSPDKLCNNWDVAFLKRKAGPFFSLFSAVSLQPYGQEKKRL